MGGGWEALLWGWRVLNHKNSSENVKSPKRHHELLVGKPEPRDWPSVIRKFQSTLGTGLGHQTGSHPFPRGVILGMLTDDRNMFAHEMERKCTLLAVLVAMKRQRASQGGQGCNVEPSDEDIGLSGAWHEAWLCQGKGKSQAENPQPQELVEISGMCLMADLSRWKDFLLCPSPINPWAAQVTHSLPWECLHGNGFQAHGPWGTFGYCHVPVAPLPQRAMVPSCAILSPHPSGHRTRGGACSWEGRQNQNRERGWFPVLPAQATGWQWCPALVGRNGGGPQEPRLLQPGVLCPSGCP